MTRAKATPPLEVLFWTKVEKGEGCWVWLAALSDTGYGVIRTGGVLKRAHRVAYELEVGPIPEGKQLDHKCHNRACVRPSHLQPVTNQQNAENRAGAPAHSRSGIRGVHWHEGNQSWRVEATRHGERHYGGYFRDLGDAERAAIELRRALLPNSLMDRLVAS